MTIDSGKLVSTEKKNDRDINLDLITTPPPRRRLDGPLAEIPTTPVRKKLPLSVVETPVILASNKLSGSAADTPTTPVSKKLPGSVVEIPTTPVSKKLPLSVVETPVILASNKLSGSAADTPTTPVSKKLPGSVIEIPTTPVSKKLPLSVVETPVILASNKLSGSAADTPTTPVSKKLPGSVVEPPVTLSANTALTTLIAAPLAPASVKLPGFLLTTLAGEKNVFTSLQPSIEVKDRISANAQTATISVTYNGFTPQAQAAFQYAVDIWESLLVSNVEIKVDAYWKPLGPGVLGSCGPDYFIRDFGAGVAGTWYPAALANKVAGSDLDPSGGDITANFSSTFNWYLGTDGNTPSNQFDFATVVLHELGHGLGLIGLMSVDSGTGQGQWGYGTGYPGIYDRFTENGSGQSLINTALFTNPSIALGSQLTSNNLFFDGPNAVAANNGIRPKLFAPSPWQSGSSYSHLDENTYAPGTPNSLMTPYLDYAEAIHNPGPITMGILRDSGWSTPDPVKTIAIAKTTDGKEQGSLPTVFTLTRTGSLSSALSVNFVLTGTATRGSDYTGNSPGTATFGAGAAATTITLPTVDDSVFDPNETIVATITVPTGYTLSGSASATATIADNDVSTAVVTLANNFAGVSEDAAPNIVYTFSRTGPLAQALQARFTITGSATPNNDYIASGATIVGTSGTITFAAGAATSTLNINTLSDLTKEDNETVSVQLVSGTGYQVGTSSAVVSTIINDDGVLNQLGTNAADYISAGSTLILSGRNGNDRIIGSRASEVISGGLGADLLTGGGGSDLFTYDTPQEGMDTITDFNKDDDIIQVSGAKFSASLVTGETLNPLQFSLGALTASTRFIYNSATGLLSFDADGSGSLAATAFTRVSAGTALTNENIFIC